jgi:hypothetical protein
LPLARKVKVSEEGFDETKTVKIKIRLLIFVLMRKAFDKIVEGFISFD